MKIVCRIEDCILPVTGFWQEAQRVPRRRGSGFHSEVSLVLKIVTTGEGNSTHLYTIDEEREEREGGEGEGGRRGGGVRGREGGGRRQRKGRRGERGREGEGEGGDRGRGRGGEGGEEEVVKEGVKDEEYEEEKRKLMMINPLTTIVQKAFCRFATVTVHICTVFNAFARTYFS